MSRILSRDVEGGEKSQVEIWAMKTTPDGTDGRLNIADLVDWRI